MSVLTYWKGDVYEAPKVYIFLFGINYQTNYFVIQPGDSSITHIVVDDASITTLPENLRAPDSDPHIVKSEWFWASIQVMFTNFILEISMIFHSFVHLF